MGNPYFCLSLKPQFSSVTGTPSVGFTFGKNGNLRTGNCFRRVSLRASAAIEDGFLASTQQEQSFYDLLGISERVGFSEIKHAYKQMARRYHPDVSPPDRVDEHTRRFIQVQEAYETLSDPRRRALYDRDLGRGLHLAFSARKRFDEELEEKSRWRNRWQDQITELKRSSMHKNSGEHTSWAAQMRRQKRECSME